ncbi:hypothetical protein CFP56_027174 [Quercus suber]|uniref:Uncharacterized protein n=1 Tax=Quercus suber TaxID=58331 RepID=A0AAW0JZI1_QUESU
MDCALADNQMNLDEFDTRFLGSLNYHIVVIIRIMTVSSTLVLCRGTKDIKPKIFTYSRFLRELI